MDNIDWICSKLHLGLDAGLVEVTGTGSTLVIQGGFDPVGSEEVDKTLRAVSTNTSVLGLGPSWLIKVSQKGINWVLICLTLL